MRKDNLSEIRKDIDFCIGQKVLLTTNKGKKKADTKEGIVEGTYSNVFTVKLNSPEAESRTSYSYTDVLTRTVEIIKCSDNSNIYQRFNQ